MQDQKSLFQVCTICSKFAICNIRLQDELNFRAAEKNAAAALLFR